MISKDQQQSAREYQDRGEGCTGFAKGQKWLIREPLKTKTSSQKARIFSECGKRGQTYTDMVEWLDAH